MERENDEDDGCYTDWVSDNYSELREQFCEDNDEFHQFCSEQYKASRDEHELQSDLNRNR